MLRRAISFLSIGLLVLMANFAPAQQSSKPDIAGAGRRVALVIGNTKYTRKPLPAAADDAKAMEQVLRRLSFDVRSATDTTRKQFAEEVDHFISALKPNDVALFYYSGHGIQLAGENYLLGIDFAGVDKYDVQYDGYALDRIQERIEHSGAALSILILDASHDNPFGDSKSALGGLRAGGGGRGTFLAFASATGTTSVDEDTSSSSLFTTHLVQALTEPGRTLDQIFNKVRAEVVRESNGRQVPVQFSSLSGTFYFLPPAKSADDVFRDGLTLLKAGKAREAVSLFDQAIGIRPAYLAAYLRRAQSFSLLGEKKQAQEDFEEAIRLRPTGGDGYLHRALAYLSLGRFERAMTDLEMAIQFESGASEAHEYRGLVLSHFGEWNDATKEFDEAIRLMPGEIHLYEARGKAYLYSGKAELAIEDFTRVIQARPNIVAYQDRAVAYQRLHRYELAVADYNKIIEDEAGPRTVLDPLHNLTYESAVPNFMKVVALRDGSPATIAYLARASLHEQLKQRDLARKELRELSHLSSGDAEIHRIIGSRFESFGDYTAAEEEFRIALQIDPDDHGALNALGYMFAERGVHLDEALEFIDHALKFEPNNGAYLDSLGWVYYRLNKLEMAEHYIKMSLQGPVQVEQHEHLGDVYWAQGRKSEAAREWESALKQFESWLPLLKANESSGSTRWTESPERLRNKLAGREERNWLVPKAVSGVQ